MNIDTKKMQSSLDEVVATGVFNNTYGREVLNLIDATIRRSSLYNRFSDFELQYIIVPKMTDYLLLKAFKYNKSRATAHTFMSTVVHNALSDGISDVYRARRGDFSELIDDKLYKIKDETDSLQLIESPEVFTNKIY